MKEQDKQLLLKDLCARLPYGVMVHFEGWNIDPSTGKTLIESGLALKAKEGMYKQ